MNGWVDGHLESWTIDSKSDDNEQPLLCEFMDVRDITDLDDILIMPMGVHEEQPQEMRSMKAERPGMDRCCGQGGPQ